MSYDIIKGIKIENGRVFAKAASNNVYPRTFEWDESTSLSRILKEEGELALELEIFRQFENGNFQGYSGKYVRALQVLRHFPEYKDFDWRIDAGEDKRKSPEFAALLERALKTRLPKDKFIVAKDNYGQVVYLCKITRRYARWTGRAEDAKVFRFQNEAEFIKKCFTGGEHWSVEKVA